ncbi:MAG TPA: hypothetical protein VKT77_01725 [Chthonomonadaceae bacterium]|nr:hypothetical protein [Chthonomonadaceae bacterium]
MKRIQTLGAIGLTLAMGATCLSAPITASASEEGKRNTAYALGAAAAALLLTQHNKAPGLIAAGGAAVAFGQLGHDRDYGDRDYRDRDYRDGDRDYRDREHARFENDNRRDRRLADDNWRR